MAHIFHQFDHLHQVQMLRQENLIELIIFHSLKQKQSIEQLILKQSL